MFDFQVVKMMKWVGVLALVALACRPTPSAAFPHPVDTTLVVTTSTGAPSPPPALAPAPAAPRLFHRATFGSVHTAPDRRGNRFTCIADSRAPSTRGIDVTESFFSVQLSWVGSPAT